MKITVLEACDGFSILIEDEIGSKYFNFGQEDDKTDLVKVFEYLGFEAEYEEDY